jgi:hypothetical protein
MRCIVMTARGMPGAEVEVLHEHVSDPAAVLRGAEVVVAMRERTAFPAELFDALPDLRLLVTTGWRTRRSTWSRRPRTG